ncbi:MAG: hypothetical protein K2L19_02280 [Eubacterium sp.]|nr:hypothetical protein [Eubacterium sp.]
MKKLLSIILAAVMTVTVFALSVVPAMAADTVNSPTASTAERKDVTLQVNGVVTKTAITYGPSANKNNTVVFTYKGEGALKGWENNMESLGFVAGKDFTATTNADGTYEITFITDEAMVSFSTGKVVVNALVDLGTGTTSVTATTKKNDSSKAPATGISSSVVAGSVAVAFAGAAVLAATKKKDAE